MPPPRIVNIVDVSRGYEEVINSVTVTTGKPNGMANFKRCVEVYSNSKGQYHSSETYSYLLSKNIDHLL
jgi:hypothetical protein